MKIAVLYGGTSAEREVSLSTGKGIIRALEKNGHDVIGIDFNPSKLKELADLDVDFVFIGLHGRYGEDGRIQGYLDMLGLPYVGSGVLGSALAMDKAKSKKLFEKEGIRVAKDITLRKTSPYEPEQLDSLFTYPVVVKPNSEGSTIGLTIAEDKETMVNGVKEAFEHDDVVMVEEFISGREVTVAVIGLPGNEKSLPVIEIIPKNNYYDYESKYAPGGSEHIVPARLEEEVTARLKKDAVLAHRALGCEVYSRVDFIVPEDGSTPVILEVNTLPGMTPTSLYPDAARATGLSYEEMVQKLLDLSVASRQTK